MGLASGRREVIDQDVQVQPVLDHLDLGHPLKSQLSPVGRQDITAGPVAFDGFSTQHLSLELRDSPGIRAIDDDLVDASNHLRSFSGQQIGHRHVVDAQPHSLSSNVYPWRAVQNGVSSGSDA